jgi:hypothetical protein
MKGRDDATSVRHRRVERLDGGGSAWAVECRSLLGWPCGLGSFPFVTPFRRLGAASARRPVYEVIA